MITVDLWRQKGNVERTGNTWCLRWRMSRESAMIFFFFYIYISSAVGQPAKKSSCPALRGDALIVDQFEVSECTLPGPSVGDITEDGVVASCHPPLAWDTNGRDWDYNHNLSNMSLVQLYAQNGTKHPRAGR